MNKLEKLCKEAPFVYGIFIQKLEGEFRTHLKAKSPDTRFSQSSQIDIPVVHLGDITTKYSEGKAINTDTLQFEPFIISEKLKSVTLNKGKSLCNFPIIGISTTDESEDSAIIAVPSTTILRALFKDSSIGFYRFQLRNLCSSLFRRQINGKLSITRISFQIHGEPGEKVRSFTCHGDDTLHSNLIADASSLDDARASAKKREGDELATKITPFNKDIGKYGGRFLDPTSLQIRLENSDGTNFEINIDRFGHFSTQLRTTGSLAKIREVLYSFRDASALSPSQGNPMIRSLKDLQNISGNNEDD